MLQQSEHLCTFTEIHIKVQVQTSNLSAALLYHNVVVLQCMCNHNIKFEQRKNSSTKN